jgi:hypothetical protein
MAIEQISSDQMRKIREVACVAAVENLDKSPKQIIAIITPEIDKILGGEEKTIVLYPTVGIEDLIKRQQEELIQAIC